MYPLFLKISEAEWKVVFDLSDAAAISYIGRHITAIDGQILAIHSAVSHFEASVQDPFVLPLWKEASAILRSMQGVCPICSDVAKKKCGNCGFMRACGAEHQKESWPIHKKFCCVLQEPNELLLLLIRNPPWSAPISPKIANLIGERNKLKKAAETSSSQ